MESAPAAAPRNPAEPAPAASGGPPVTSASDITAAGAEERQASVHLALEALASKLRDTEVALIGRIADVDDDRRRTGIEVRRALDAQRDEFDRELRRRGLAATLFVLLALLLAVGAAVLSYYLVDANKAEISGQLSGIQEAVARLSEIDTAPLDKRLGQLDEAVTRLSGDLEKKVEKVEARQSGVNDLVTRLQGLEETLASKSEPAAEPEVLSDEFKALETAGADLAKKVEDLQKAQDRLGKDMLLLRDSLANILASANLPLERQSFAPEESRPEQGETKPAEAAPQESGSPAAQATAPGAKESGNQPPPAATPATPGGQTQGQPPTAADSPPAGSSAASGLAVIRDARAPTASGSDPGESDVVLTEPQQALQLISFRDLEAVRRFAQRPDLPSRVYFRTESRGGRPWYAVFFGLYPDATAAAAAKAALPAELAALQPLVRPLKAADRLQFLDRAP